jgi:hypothetical protein
MSAVINVHFDTTELNAALAALYKVSDKTPAALVNQKGGFIFGRASGMMKVVEKSTIQTELDASPAQLLVKLKNGKFSKAKKNIKQFFGDAGGDTEGFPLLAAIIQARAGKSGKGSPWKGVDRATGAQRMLDAMRTVFNARISSRGYFRRCFQVAAYAYRKAKLPTKFKISKLFVEKEYPTIGSLSQRLGIIAGVTPAREGESRAISTFWIKTTEHDIGGKGIREHAEPVLQAAFDAEAESTWQHEAEAEYKAVISALGIRVT